MQSIQQEKFSQCQNALEKLGYCVVKLTLPETIISAVKDENYNELDRLIRGETQEDGLIFKHLKTFCPLKDIEFILSLREAKNEWEEDGIWHDDGSRIMAFSLSLTLTRPEGGVLELRKKGSKDSYKITTPDFGDMIIFKTGVENYEHKINRVTKGARLIAAGWCYPSKIS